MGCQTVGRWIDLTIVLWVLVALVVSMLLYIATWWRHLRAADPNGVNTAERWTTGATQRLG